MVGLLADQYKDGGTRILNNHTMVRNNQKIQMQREMDDKKQELAKVYSDAIVCVDKRKQDVQRYPVSTFEKEWKKEQGSTQAKISQRRRSSM